MEAVIFGYAPVGMVGELVTVEVDLRRGIPGVDIVGLPDDAVRESRERVRAAIRNSGFEFPRDRVLINLSPVGLRKVGAAYDLALALAVLIASEQVARPLAPTLVCGELTLGGAVQSVRGAMAAVLAARRRGVGAFLVPSPNLAEAAAVGGDAVVGVASLAEAARQVGRIGDLSTAPVAAPTPGSGAATVGAPPPGGPSPWRQQLGSVSDIRGHAILKRALLIAAAGGHHLLLFGPPGTGKTMAARRLVGLLPALTYPQSVEATQIQSLAGALEPATGLARWPPFREPHHSASPEGLLGGSPALSR